MKLFAIIELPADSQLTTQCPDLVTLGHRISLGIREAVMVSTFAADTPTIRLQWGPPSEICGRCAAPLLPSGACSSKNCPVGRQPFKGKKITPAQICKALASGIRLGSTLKKA